MEKIKQFITTVFSFIMGVLLIKVIEKVEIGTGDYWFTIFLIIIGIISFAANASALFTDWKRNER